MVVILILAPLPMQAPTNLLGEYQLVFLLLSYLLLFYFTIKAVKKTFGRYSQLLPLIDDSGITRVKRAALAMFLFLASLAFSLFLMVKTAQASQ